MEEGSPSKKVRSLKKRAAESWVACLPPNRRVQHVACGHLPLCCPRPISHLHPLLLFLPVMQAVVQCAGSKQPKSSGITGMTGKLDLHAAGSPTAGQQPLGGARATASRR